MAITIAQILGSESAKRRLKQIHDRRVANTLAWAKELETGRNDGRK